MAALANSSRRCLRLLATPECANTYGAEIDRLSQMRTLPRIERVERGALDQMLPVGAVHQGLALAADPLPPASLDDLFSAAPEAGPSIIMVLDQITDPHNLGAILRSAAAFGALGIVTTDRHSPGETGTLAKAASGALEHVPVVREVNLARALDELKREGYWIVGLDTEAPVTLAAAKLSGRIGLVLGAEGEGMRRLTRERCDLIVKLPQTEGVESLNVSNAAAVALYELIRR
jgi:23S rRNA (guanosine2251-2'-O)-methyltransferase